MLEQLLEQMLEQMFTKGVPFGRYPRGKFFKQHIAVANKVGNQHPLAPSCSL